MARDLDPWWVGRACAALIGRRGLGATHRDSSSDCGVYAVKRQGTLGANRPRAGHKMGGMKVTDAGAEAGVKGENWASTYCLGRCP
jgi:hypothetical protein